ncbi:hypothetical protein K491DRAFT_597300 [Lophiostoma macrostomum CBS 122681]|uniref:Amidohydrolase 3 domain-containing protein n=1 Tax=Lophiostoma macrostomum CBS 122681 TaxID=1314788 RepID=A0A6A6T9I9_9PLEO|nr:hypothetical protein K491DRAFT_597300 [Lophiostoma macrostomum CBS 122681]
MSSLFWLSIPLLLAAIVYQVGTPVLVANLISGNIFFNIISNIFSTTHCYVSVSTLSSTLPNAECFSVSNGKFSRVFLDQTSFKITKEARTGHVIPGLWDGHGHLVQYGELLDSVNLFGAMSMDDVRRLLIDYKASHKQAGTPEQWLRGIGWDQANFEGRWPIAPDLEINDAFEQQYVMLDRVDVHCIWVSEAVLALLPSPLPDVTGGEIPAKGVFCDNAMDVVMQYYPRPNKERKTKFVQDAMWELNKLGIVGIHDAGVFPAELDLYEELSQGKDWNVRVYAMMECETRNTFCPAKARKIATSNEKLFVRSVKLFGDGALGSWGSAMIEPYSDKNSSSGSLLVNATTLSKLTLDWSTAGYQVNIHAIGDLANRLAVDAFTEAFERLCPGQDHRECQTQRRFRIEHSQIIHPDDQQRIFDSGIIPSIQPTHATSDMAYAEKRLGRTRTEHEAYRMRSLLPLGPVFGSDFPVEPANVFEGIFAAVTRRSPQTGLDADGGTEGWYTEETVTVRQALEGFTIHPAYAAFLEGKAGVIQPGAYADWVVLDDPIDAIDIESLRNVTVRETWVGGRRVYKRPGPEDIPRNG